METAEQSIQRFEAGGYGLGRLVVPVGSIWRVKEFGDGAGISDGYEICRFVGLTDFEDDFFSGFDGTVYIAGVGVVRSDLVDL